jgi:UDP-N-acetylmuramoyl-tripeptide--D-alanyl-D-alanine ligase
MTIEQLYELYLAHPVISTDTRKIAPGSIFFALKGDKFDANTFAAQALEAGAAYVIIDNVEYDISNQCILVDDVLTALQELARHHRRQLNIPVIGLTGTNGKTTTKELINAVLSQRFVTHATQGNLNNHIGVPLTLLALTYKHEIAVIEMGANHQKEIALLSSITQPTHGLITNVGRAHLEGFGGVEGVKIGKGELYDYLKDSNGIAFINSNSVDLMKMQADRDLSQTYFYGTGQADNFISGELTENAPYLKLSWTNNQTQETHEVQSQLTGAYNLDNILAAITIGTFFKLDAKDINTGISTYAPGNNRSQIVKTATNTLVCDYYNANPSSMAVAIDNLSQLQADRKVLILGDMFEMGDDAAAEHQFIVQKALDAQVTDRIFVGKEFCRLLPQHNAVFYENAEDAITALQQKPITNATILIKGSRGMALERLVPYL